MDFFNQLPFAQKFNKALPKAAPANPFPHIALPGGVPGASATKTVLNSPALKGLAKNVGRATSLTALPEALGLVEGGLAGMDNEYGRKVAGARDQRENSLDALAGMGIGGVFNSAFREPSPEMGSLDGKRSVANIGGVSYDLSTPEGERGFSNARKDALKVQTDKGVMPGQLPSDYKETEAAAFRGAATGTNTSTSRRDDPRNAEYIKQRSALTADSTDAERKVVQDAGMAAWAKANPGLVRGVMEGGSKQSGYDVIQKAAGLENSAVSNYDADQTFTGKDIKEEYRQNLGDSGIEGITDAQTNAGADKKAQDFLKNYEAQISGKLSPLVENGIPSDSQNPRIANTDYTPIDSEIELSKVVPDFAGKMDGLNKNMSNRFRAF